MCILHDNTCPSASICGWISVLWGRSFESFETETIIAGSGKQVIIPAYRIY
jgi:hypothetical protein